MEEEGAKEGGSWHARGSEFCPRQEKKGRGDLGCYLLIFFIVKQDPFF